MEQKEFETIDLVQLEEVAGGGRIGRKIKKALKKFFSDFGGEVEGDLDAYYHPSNVHGHPTFG